MGGGKGPFGAVSMKESGKDKLLRAVSVAVRIRHKAGHEQRLHDGVAEQVVITATIKIENA